MYKFNPKPERMKYGILKLKPKINHKIYSTKFKEMQQKQQKINFSPKKSWSWLMPMARGHREVNCGDEDGNRDSEFPKKVLGPWNCDCKLKWHKRRTGSHVSLFVLTDLDKTQRCAGTVISLRYMDIFLVDIFLVSNKLFDRTKYIHWNVYSQSILLVPDSLLTHNFQDTIKTNEI